MSQFSQDDLKILQNALIGAKTLASGGEVDVAKNWECASINFGSEAATREEVFVKINNYKGVGWVETTDAIFIRSKENGKWWNLSKFLRSGKQEEFDKFPDKFAVLAAELAQEKKSTHINHIHGEDWQIDEIAEEEGDLCLRQKVSYLGLGSDDNQYEIIYHVYWEIIDDLPKQKCARFVGFKPLNAGDKND